VQDQETQFDSDAFKSSWNECQPAGGDFTVARPGAAPKPLGMFGPNVVQGLGTTSFKISSESLRYGPKGSRTVQVIRTGKRVIRTSQ
jgi:hypothetical protein